MVPDLVLNGYNPTQCVWRPTPLEDRRLPLPTRKRLTGNWPAACASKRTRRARPSSSNALSATLSASSSSKRCSVRSTNPLHSAICSPSGFSCAATRALASAVLIASTSAPVVPSRTSKTFSNLVIFSGIWGKLAVAQWSSSLPPWHVAMKPRAQLEWPAKNFQGCFETVDPARCCGRTSGLLEVPPSSATWVGCNAPRPDWRGHFSDRGLGLQITCNQPSGTSTSAHSLIT